jgi:hypothetical protein
MLKRNSEKSFLIYFYKNIIIEGLGGTMIVMLSSSTENCELNRRLGLTKVNKIAICYFSPNSAASTNK